MFSLLVGSILHLKKFKKIKARSLKSSLGWHEYRHQGILNAPGIAGYE